VTRLTCHAADVDQYHEAFDRKEATPPPGKRGNGRQPMRDTVISRFVVLLAIWLIALTPLFFM
jgi:hypothetical protein